MLNAGDEARDICWDKGSCQDLHRAGHLRTFGDQLASVAVVAEAALAALVVRAEGLSQTGSLGAFSGTRRRAMPSSSRV